MAIDDTAEYKIKITPDTTAIDDLEKKLAEYAKNGAEVKAKLGIGGEQPQAGASGPDRFQVSLDSFVNKLSKLIDKIDKNESKEKQEKQEKQLESNDTQKQIAKQIALLPNALSSSRNALGFLGAAAGSLGGPIGSVVGGIVGDLVGKGLNKAQEGFFDILKENLKLRVLSEQTGRTTESLYKLKTQADLVGSSLETISRTNATLADEIVGGLSPEKAQLFLSAGIDLRELYDKNGGDLEKVNQAIFDKVDKALSTYSAPLRAAQLRRFGFSDEEQTARRHLYEPGVVDRAREVLQVATIGGNQPITPANKVQEQATKFLGAQAEIEGALRALFTTGNYALKVSSSLVTIEADVINLVNKSIAGVDGGIGSTVSNVYNNTVNSIGNFFDRGVKYAQRSIENNLSTQGKQFLDALRSAQNKVATPR